MKIIITGGAGFVGSSLAMKWKELYPSYTIIAADNLVRRGSEINLPSLRAANIDFIHADIRNVDDINVFPDCDVIVDASADPSVLAGIQSSTARLIQSNLVGTANLLEWASNRDAKFVFLSTSRVYPFGSLNEISLEEEDTRFAVGQHQRLSGISGAGISEAFPLAGARSFYGAAKLSSELLIEEYIALKGLRASILRCGVIAGPGQFGKIDQGVVVFWLANHYWKKKLAYFGYGGTGKQVRDIFHVHDLFRLVDQHIHTNVLEGKTVNVGGGMGNSLSLQELTKMCETITGNRVSVDAVSETRIADVPFYVTDNTKVASLSGWKPEQDIQNVLSETFDWIQKNEKQLKYILA